MKHTALAQSLKTEDWSNALTTEMIVTVHFKCHMEAMEHENV